MKSFFSVIVILLGISLSSKGQSVQPSLEETLGWIKSKIRPYYTCTCKWNGDKGRSTTYVYVDSIIIKKCTLILYVKSNWALWYYDEKGEKLREASNPDQETLWVLKLDELSSTFDTFHAFKVPQKLSEESKGEEYSGIILFNKTPTVKGEKFYLGLNPEPDIQNRTIKAIKYAKSLCEGKGE
jgi:hypothetical protein